MAENNSSKQCLPPNAVQIIGYVEPSAYAKGSLGHGVYSLNKRSNVPFVEIAGSAGHKKTITWGETVTIPEGQTASIRNVSYHGGDIFLNNGYDIDNRPSRITVPVAFHTVSFTYAEAQADAWASRYSCDTRTAKRAYLAIDAVTKNNLASPVSVFVRGRKLDGSMATQNPLQGFTLPFGPGVGFVWGIEYLSDTLLSLIPLGYGCSAGDDSRPHMLLDAADVFLTVGPTGTPLSNILRWPVVDYVPSTAQSAPASWWVIEYD